MASVVDPTHHLLAQDVDRADDIFSYYKINLHSTVIDPKPLIEASEEFYYDPREVSDKVRPSARGDGLLFQRPRTKQYCLNLSPMNQECYIDNVVVLIPKRNVAYLYYGVYDTFRDISAASRAAAKLENCGYYSIGHLVKEKEEVVMKFPFMDVEALTLMKQRLGSVGLCFNMRINRRPVWDYAIKHRCPSNNMA